MNFKIFLLAAACAAASRPLSAGAAPIELKTWNRVRQDYSDPDCQAHGDCDLVRFTLITEDYRVSGGKLVGPSYGTRMTAVYRTGAVGSLEKYGIASFLRGCAFSSRVQDGSVVKAQDVSYWLRENAVPLHFPTWVIDGFVADPLNWGDSPRESRYDFYQWNADPDSLDPDTAHYVVQSPPTSPALFVTDHPSSAYWDAARGVAHNFSLQFRTCLYKSADVPQSVPYDKTDFAVPVKCFDWSTSFIYDHARGRFETKPELDPFCRQSAPAAIPQSPDAIQSRLGWEQPL